MGGQSIGNIVSQTKLENVNETGQVIGGLLC